MVVFILFITELESVKAQSRDESKNIALKFILLFSQHTVPNSFYLLLLLLL